MVGYGDSCNRPHVPETLAVVRVRIAVQDLTPHATARSPHPVVPTWHRCEITHDQHRRSAGVSLPHKAQDAAGCIVTIYPGETLRMTVAFIQRWSHAIQAIQVLDPALHASVYWVGEQVPIYTGVVVPLPPLAELAPHEQ